jgi:parvulin-like peptidyl-prolyl isomerase
MMKRTLKVIIGAVIMTLALSGLSCTRDKTEKGGKPPVPPEHGKVVEKYKESVEESKKVVAAKVNGTDIRMNELVALMNRIAPKYITDMQKRTPEIDEKVKKEALDILIFRELAVQEAARQGMKVRPEAVDETMKKLKTGLGSEEAYRKYLERSDVTEESLRKQIEKDTLFNMISAKEIIQKVKKVDEKFARDVYNREKATYIAPDGFLVEDVFVPGGKDDKAVMNKAKEVLSLIKKNNNDLSKLAQDKTIAVRNGTVTAQEYPNIYRTAEGMKSGDLSGIVGESDGLHIIKLRQKEPSRQLTFEEVRGMVEQKLMVPVIKKRKEQWENGLRKSAKIELIQAKGEKKITPVM